MARFEKLIHIVNHALDDLREQGVLPRCITDRIAKESEVKIEWDGDMVTITRLDGFVVKRQWPKVVAIVAGDPVINDDEKSVTFPLTVVFEED